MFSLKPTPEIPKTRSSGAFVQTIQLLDGEVLIGRAIWAATDPSDGVIQLIEFWIDPTFRRAGHGRQLLRGLVEQARGFHTFRSEILRRLWVGVGHKSQVVGRAFLSSEGFHLITSTGGLMQDEEQLIYG